MALINQVLAEGARVIIRQTVATALSTATPTSTPAPTELSALGGTNQPSATSFSSSTTDSAVNGQPTNGNGNNNGQSQQGQNNSSPLLFFVALGFGVVFTNLWIIVGVKYCFRYNARNRQMRLNEDGEPINLDNMPRPHRRRREKKLMTMDEVNEKFPMQKYKNWVASRAQEGLPTRGGVTAPPSRANSLRDVAGVVPELPSKEREADEPRPSTSPSPNAATEKPAVASTVGEGASTATAPVTSDSHAPPTTTELRPVADNAGRASPEDEDEEEDDEHINAALPPECMGTAGDTCAICIDTLEDDDDVRGLTCGHAFHAVCLDPWLTSRRACCPLCKADYYTPKPRPAAAEPGDATGTVTVSLNDPRRINMPQRGAPTWVGIRGHGRMMLPSRFIIAGRGGEELPVTRTQSNTTRPAQVGRRAGLFGRQRNQPEQQSQQPEAATAISPTAAETHTPEVSSQPNQSRLATVRSAFSAFRMPRRGNAEAPEGPVASGANPEVTPSILESGVRQHNVEVR